MLAALTEWMKVDSRNRYTDIRKGIILVLMKMVTHPQVGRAIVQRDLGLRRACLGVVWVKCIDLVSPTMVMHPQGTMALIY